ncbi:MAG: efflux RND transporter periplasmic adaptor subunit [Gammaproteobacteria bacterium]|nr:efflux RND transporter periplasmic adaptor subunit [Gammaproteobacteria bacterium]MDH5322181.1 efflux RND transporter periplasmic adaptor subunit [Gammaproteobacteria bacterium]
MNILRSMFAGLAGVAISTVALAQGFGPSVVVTADAELRELAPSVEVPGTVVSRYDSRLASELSAKLIWIAEVGTVVKKDETVARLEDFTFKLQEMEAQARVEREQARVKFLRSEKDRLDQLAEKNLSAKSQLDQTISDLAIAESEETMARVQLGLTQISMHVTQIRAPFDGIVTERLRNIGERLNVADEVIRVVDPDSLEVVARAPLNTVNFIKDRAVLEMHNDYRSDVASVRTIVPFGNPQSHMFEVRLDANPDIWTVGESVRLAMPTADAKQVLTVPRDALVLRREGASVFRIKDDMTAEQVQVITGLSDGIYIEVIGEIQAGDQVVTRGAERLGTGMQVTVNSAAVAGSGTGTAATN